MTGINYTSSSDARTAGPEPYPPNAVRIELQGLPENVASLATLIGKQLDVLKESSDIQETGGLYVRRELVAIERGADRSL
jgi:hypothetical protein